MGTIQKLLPLTAVLASLAVASPAAAHGRHHHHHARPHHHAIHRYRAHKADAEAFEELTWPEWEHECLTEGLEPEWCAWNREEGEAAEREWFEHIEP